MVCFLGREAAIREAPAGVRTGASAAPASVSQGRNPVAPVPNQRGCCSEPSHWLPDKLRLGRDVPREEAPAGDLFQGEEIRQPRLPGWGALMPSHKNPPLVIRPKEEARKNRAASLLGVLQEAQTNFMKSPAENLAKAQAFFKSEPKG